MLCYFYVVLHILKMLLNKVFKSDRAGIKSNKSETNFTRWDEWMNELF